MTGHQRPASRPTLAKGTFAAAVALLVLVVVAAVAVFVGRPGGSESSPTPSGSPQSTAAALIGGTPAGEVVFVLQVEDVGQDAAVVALDRVSGAQLASYPIGHDPGAVTSAAGDRLYVASGIDQGSYLSVIDTATGRVLQHVSFANRWRNTLPAYFPVMALSPGGRWLYGLKVQSTGQQADVYSVAVFDTQTGAFLPGELAVPGCIGGLLVPFDSKLDVACPHSGTLFSAPVSADGGFGLPSSTQASDFGFVGAARIAGSPDVMLLTKANKIVRVGSAGVIPVMALASEGSEVPVFDAFAVSADGTRAFIGLGGPASEQISTIQSYDLTTGRLIATAHLPTDAWTMTLAADGLTLYAPSLKAHQILVLETSQLRLVTQLQVTTPAMVLGR